MGMPKISDETLKLAARMARRILDKRAKGATEIRLTEAELTAICGLAIELGKEVEREPSQ